ncbi:MAG TPA: M48 family metallopeptidase [Allosphingosinicella sp.]|uniref:M48 family metalloprotease n=1 Tax=Allosphingosinicella sp. TaxID=2823234 RepID=UPI002F2913D5
MASVAYRLSLANAARCADILAPQHGLILHSLEQYGAADRQEAARHFGLGANVNVMAVVEGSPAARAGLAADDRLIAINGQALAANAAAPLSPSRAPVERAERMIAQALENGEIVLRVRSSRGEHDVRFLADRGCPANVELLPADVVNAWADGERVVVSVGILRRCRDDDDLALVIAHELAHNLLHHGRRLASAPDRQGRLFLPSGAAARGTQKAEEEADRLAVRLARAAGYDLTGAGEFLTDVAGASPSAPGARTHPTLRRRLALLKREIAAGRD